MLKWSRRQFQIEAQQFVSALATIPEGSHDGESAFLKGWNLERKDANESGYYLYHYPVKRSIDIGSDDQRKSDVNVDTRTSDSEDDLYDETIHQDEPEILALLSNVKPSTTEWYFSIVYNETWKAPVLYFTVDRNGSPCPRSEVLKLLTQFSHYNRVDDAWEFLSQEEHPVSRTPSFFLHPCRTMERLETLISTNEGKFVEEEKTYLSEENDTTKKYQGPFLLLSWMSMILPSVGYSIPPNNFLKLKHILTQEG